MSPALGQPVRRRRSWYRRRVRAQRTLLAVTVFLLLAAISWQSVAKVFSLPRIHASDLLPDSFWQHGNVRARLSQATVQAVAPRPQPHRTVYPYSVIPGGIASVVDLREQAARDYVVRRHFANFAYRFAHIIQVHAAREVYLSYRLGDRVVWTTKKVHLHPGEELITDGNITARTRCGNQISETPQGEVAAEEPSEDVLDKPVGPLERPANTPLQLALLNAPHLPGLDVDPPAGPHLFAGTYSFPYVPFGPPVEGICTPQSSEKHCHSKHRHSVAPEPGTWVLLLTGIAAMFGCYARAHHWRRRNAPAANA